MKAWFSRRPADWEQNIHSGHHPWQFVQDHLAHVPQFTHPRGKPSLVWWCQQAPFERLSKNKSQSCASVAVLFNVVILSFLLYLRVATPPSWSAMPDTLKSSANDREKGLATASFPWMEEKSIGFLFIFLSKLCRGPQRHDVERQQAAWPTWNTAAIKESQVFSRVKQQLASKIHELSW